MLGRWELGQGKRKCSPPKACSVMLRHRDSRVGLISRSGPGTGQSDGREDNDGGEERTNQNGKREGRETRDCWQGAGAKTPRAQKACTEGWEAWPGETNRSRVSQRRQRDSRGGGGGCLAMQKKPDFQTEEVT